MFDKLKNVVGDTALTKVANDLAPKIKDQLTEVLKLSPTVIADDEQYKKFVVDPTLLGISAASSGVTSLIPNFDQRFLVAMLHLRDECIVLDESGQSVALAADYQNRLPSVLAAGFKKAMAA